MAEAAEDKGDAGKKDAGKVEVNPFGPPLALPGAAPAAGAAGAAAVMAHPAAHGPAVAASDSAIHEYLPKGQNGFWENLRRPYFGDEIHHDWFSGVEKKKHKKQDFINSVKDAVKEGEYTADESKIRGAMKTVLNFG